MFSILKRKYSLFVWLFALTAILSMLANFSFYYFSGCVGIAILITLAYTIYCRSSHSQYLSSCNVNSAVAYLLIWSFIYLCSFIKTGVFVDGIFWLFILYGVFFVPG